MTRYNGALISKVDPRDYDIDRLVPPSMAVTLPEEFMLNYPKNIKDQGSVGSCVAHALSSIKEIEEFYQGSSKQLSPGYIYANRRGFNYFGEGMYPNEALYNLKKYGVCENELFPYNEKYPKVSEKMSANQQKLDNNAVPYKISAYARLGNNDSIKKALVYVGPVLICYELYTSFNRCKGIVKLPNLKTEKDLGSHAMVCIGYKKIKGEDYFIVLNSWGNNWGDNGLCYIPFSYNRNEAWSVTDSIYPANTQKINKISFVLGKDDRVFLDDIPYSLDNDIKLIDDRIYVPLRFISETFGCNVKWIAETKQVQIINNVGNKILLTINNTAYKFNDKEKVSEMGCPKIIDNFTYVPLRLISEMLEYKVNWEENTKTAIIVKK